MHWATRTDNDFSLLLSNETNMNKHDEVKFEWKTVYNTTGLGLTRFPVAKCPLEALGVGAVLALYSRQWAVSTTMLLLYHCYAWSRLHAFTAQTRRELLISVYPNRDLHAAVHFSSHGVWCVRRWSTRRPCLKDVDSISQHLLRGESISFTQVVSGRNISV